MKIEHIPIDKLKPAEYNPRKITRQELQKLENNIKEFGMVDPLIVNKDMTVIGGHQRLKAIDYLGWDLVPCVVLDLTKEKEKLLNLSLNRISGEWDEEKLQELINELANMSVDLDLAGFDTKELDALIAEYSGPKEEEIFNAEAEADKIKTPRTKPGDIYTLGPHRLLCGDSTSITDIERLMNGEKADMLVTDPPYGVNYDPEWREGVGLGVGKRSKGKVINDDQADWSATYALLDVDVAYIWHASNYSHIVAKNLIDCGFQLINQIIWAKQHFALSRGDYHWQHEPCWYAVRKGKQHNWQGDRTQSTLWQIRNNNFIGNSNREETLGHGTQKPLECMERPIKNNSQIGDIITDPFLGSGTTLISCEQTKRVCYGMEIATTYCDVIVTRYVKYTGNHQINLNGEQINWNEGD